MSPIGAIYVRYIRRTFERANVKLYSFCQRRHTKCDHMEVNPTSNTRFSEYIKGQTVSIIDCLIRSARAIISIALLYKMQSDETRIGTRGNYWFN